MALSGSSVTDLAGNAITLGTAGTFNVGSVTTTAVTSDHAAGSTYGQLVSYTAAVTSGGGTPTGSVQFQIDGANYGAPVALVNGMASISTAALSAGPHSVDAFYTPDTGLFSDSDDSASPWEQTVSPAPLTVTAAGQTMTYGGNVPNLTFSYLGLVNGDTSASFTGSLTTTATSSSPVSNYAISQGNLAATGNYTIGTFNPSNLTIAQASQTISFGSLANQTYGAAPFSVSASATSGLAVSFSIVAGGQYASISGNTITLLGATAAGTVVTVAANQAGNANYSAAATVEQSFTIAAAAGGPVNVTSAVSINLGGYTFNHSTGMFVQSITITNISGSAITGPLTLVLADLSSGATLANSSGTSSIFMPGSSYVSLSIGTLGAGDSITLVLDFLDPTKQAITYDPLLLAGSGTI